MSALGPQEWRLKPGWAHLPLEDALRSALLQRTGRYQRALNLDPPPTIDDIIDDVSDLFEVVPLPPHIPDTEEIYGYPRSE